MNVLLLVALICCAIVAKASESSFTGSFQAGGADGYFVAKISSLGFGVYEYLLDLTGFTTTCDLSSGLTCTFIWKHSFMFIEFIFI
jgi:hypothetical protein